MNVILRTEKSEQLKRNRLIAFVLKVCKYLCLYCHVLILMIISPPVVVKLL